METQCGKLQESCQTGSSLLSESYVRHDEETNEEVGALTVDPKKIHEVVAKAWQHVFSRLDKEAKPDRNGNS